MKKKGVSHATHTFIDEWIERVYGKEYAENLHMEDISRGNMKVNRRQ